MPKWMIAPNRLADALGGPSQEEVALRLALRDLGGNQVNPEDYPQISAAVEKVRGMFPEETSRVGAFKVYPAAHRERARAYYETTPELKGLMAEQPLLDNDGIREVMGERPFGNIAIKDTHEKYSDFDEYSNSPEFSLRHELKHLTNEVENPRFQSQMYSDTMSMSNPHTRRVWEERTGLPALPYKAHPEEFDANRAAFRSSGKNPHLDEYAAARMAYEDQPYPDLIGFKMMEDAYQAYGKDLEAQWAQDPRWDEAEEEALNRALYDRGLY